MNAYDHFGEAKSLAQALHNAGFSYYAGQILGAMEEGATGTEIFMIMRARLDSILAEGAPSYLMPMVRALHDKLDDALK